MMEAAKALKAVKSAALKKNNKALAKALPTASSAVARLENALITGGSPSPSLNTLRKYAAALGKKLEIRFA